MIGVTIMLTCIALVLCGIGFELSEIRRVLIRELERRARAEGRK